MVAQLSKHNDTEYSFLNNSSDTSGPDSDGSSVGSASNCCPSHCVEKVFCFASLGLGPGSILELVGRDRTG